MLYADLDRFMGGVPQKEFVRCLPFLCYALWPADILAASRHVLQRGRRNTSCKILQLDGSVLPFCEIHINVLYSISIWFPMGAFSFLFLQYIKIFVLTLPIE